MDKHWVDIPLDAEKILFAEDLVMWFLVSHWPTHASNIDRKYFCKVDRYREFLYNGLTETIKSAIDFLDDSLDYFVSRDFFSLKNANRVSKETFIETSTNYYRICFADGFEANSFLMYCTRLTNLAGYFFTHEVKDILPIVVEDIVKAFPEGVMLSSTWDSLKKSAEKYAKIKEDSEEVLTPSDSSTDSSSDSSWETNDSVTEGSDSIPNSSSDSSWETDDSVTEGSDSSTETSSNVGSELGDFAIEQVDYDSSEMGENSETESFMDSSESVEK